ncbi:hypothetical protein FGIG_03540 [Fasciola gigantica]|uniref:Uncharacterized protein n=1 Tax=Fasciola gigantica TaxID=46835 RepID=A0A504Z2F7_FASGI|nr:hypothetical protein FGIG_03540 [Fasciola gigantica]
MTKDSTVLGYPFLSKRHPTDPVVYEDKSSILHRVPHRPAIVEPIRRVKAPIKARSVYEVPTATGAITIQHHQLGSILITRSMGNEKRVSRRPMMLPIICTSEPNGCYIRSMSDITKHGNRTIMGQKLNKSNITCKRPTGLACQKVILLTTRTKTTIADKAKRFKEANAKKSQDAKQVEELCRNFDEKAYAAQIARKEFLFEFRDANKQLIGEREQIRKLERRNTISLERLQLQLNPINWSCTLK